MLKALFEKDSRWVKSVFIILIPLFFGILFLGISHGVLSLFHITDEVTTLKLTQLFSATGMFICASFVLAYLFNSNIRQFLSLRKPSVIVLILAIPAIWSAIPMINFINDLNHQISFPESLKFIEEVLKVYEEKMAELTKLLLTSGSSYNDLVLSLLVMAVIPALGEEFLFRGVIQKSIAKNINNKILAVWITAFLFSAIHFQFYGFIPRLLLGAYFGYLLIWSRSIWLPIIAHFINNATIVLFYFFMKEKNIDFDLETVGVTGSPLWIIGSVLLFAFFTVMIWKSRRIDE